MQKRVLHLFSKYQRITNIIKSHPKPEDKLNNEPVLAFKPNIKTVYKTGSNILPYKNMNYPLSKEFEVADAVYMNELSRAERKVSPPNAKLLKIGIFGPTNVGKSALLNRLVNRNVSAVSNKCFTTTEPKIGINTDPNEATQLVFYDLPGFPLKAAKYRFLQYRAYEAIESNEISKLLIVIDSTKSVSKDMLITLDKIRQRFENDVDFTLVLTKLDLCFNRRKLNDIIAACESMMNFESKQFISSETEYGCSDLLTHFKQQAEHGEWIYNQEYITNLSEANICLENIKSIVYDRYFHEFPYEINIKLTEFYITSSHIRVRIQLNTERKLHRYMLIGKAGKNVSLLRQFISKELMRIYGKFVDVKIAVHHGLSIDQEIKMSEEATIKAARRDLEKVKDNQDIKSLKDKDPGFTLNN